MTQCLMRTINESGRLHMTPSLVTDKYIMRWCVCRQHATDDDAYFAFNVIQEVADNIIRTRNKVLRMISINKSMNISRDLTNEKNSSSIYSLHFTSHLGNSLAFPELFTLCFHCSDFLAVLARPRVILL